MDIQFIDITTYKGISSDAEHYYGKIGMTVRTSACSSVTIHGGLDYYDKVWKSFVLGATFNFNF